MMTLRMWGVPRHRLRRPSYTRTTSTFTISSGTRSIRSCTRDTSASSAPWARQHPGESKAREPTVIRLKDRPCSAAAGFALPPRPVGLERAGRCSREQASTHASISASAGAPQHAPSPSMPSRPPGSPLVAPPTPVDAGGGGRGGRGRGGSVRAANAPPRSASQPALTPQRYTSCAKHAAANLSEPRGIGANGGAAASSASPYASGARRC
jgi:hypothetical protein